VTVSATIDTVHSRDAIEPNEKKTHSLCARGSGSFLGGLASADPNDKSIVDVKQETFYKQDIKLSFPIRHQSIMSKSYMEKPPSSHLTVATQSGRIRGENFFYCTMLYSPSWDNKYVKDRD
jgi:hypothetical protein